MNANNVEDYFAWVHLKIEFFILAIELMMLPKKLHIPVLLPFFGSI